MKLRNLSRYPPDGGQVADVLSTLQSIPRGTKPLIQCGVSAIELVMVELVNRLDLLGVFPALWWRAVAEAFPEVGTSAPSAEYPATRRSKYSELELKQLMSGLQLSVSDELRFRRMLDENL